MKRPLKGRFNYSSLRQSILFKTTYKLIRYRIRAMLPRSKTIVLLICLFLIAFKAAVGSVFIQAAIEQAQIDNSYAKAPISHQLHQGAGSFPDRPHVHIMHLMSHVAGNIYEAGVIVFSVPKTPVQFAIANEVLFTQNFPDSVFKPPKA